MAVNNTVNAKPTMLSTSGFWGKDVTTPSMGKSIREWFALYFQREITKEEDPCQRIPYAIVSKLSKTVFSEYDASIADEEKNVISEWQAQNLRTLGGIRKEALQWGLVGGEALIKVIPDIKNKTFSFSVIPRDCYNVLGRDSRGKLTGVTTAEFCTHQGKFYTLMERRVLDDFGLLTLSYKLYQSNDKNYLGVPVALSTVPQYEHLPSEFTYSRPINSIGLVQLRTPIANCVDGSSDAVSVYEAAVALIHNINKNERQLDTEFENSRNRIIASSDLLKKDAFGNMSAPADLIVGFDDDPGKVGFTTFNPNIRDQSYDRRRQSYFKSCETVIGFKRGIFSDVEAAERTATEITSSAGDYNLTVIDFQNVWYDTTQEVLRVCALLGYMYNFTASALWDHSQLAMDWGNGILYDKKSEWQEKLEMVQAKMLKAEIALAWKYDLPWETPEDLAMIREKYMPELETLTGGF